MIEKIIERIAGAPARALDATVDKSRSVRDTVAQYKIVRKAHEYWHILGPGLTTGASDDDPSGIATYSQTGARHGFQLLWLAGFTFPLMAVVQEMCARIGIVTGQGLAANIKENYPRWVLILCTTLLFLANGFNIGADLGAMAKGTQLLFPGIGFGLLVIAFTALSLGLQIFSSYAKYSRYLKYLALILLCYVFAAVSAGLDWSEVAVHAVVPSLTFSKNEMILICAVLGTTISPYLFFWQTAQEVEEEILKGRDTIELRKGATDQEVRHMRLDVWSGMLLSNLVMFFIISACAATLYANGITDIGSAADAAKALRPFAGEQAYLLFALGIIGTGLLAVPVLAGSASYAISESFGWDHGLHRQLKEASAFYGVIIISMIGGLLMNFVDIDPFKALIYSAVGNGLVAPVILVLIVLISRNRSVMGERANRPLTTIVGWVITCLMALAGIGTLVSLMS